MAVDLGDYTAVLRREVSPPGSSVFTTVPDSVLEGYLADAFWEARLDGFLPAYTLLADTSAVIPLDTSDGDIPREQVALIVLYAGLKILRNQLINSQTRFSAKAGPVSFETESSANLLTEMAKQLSAVRDRLLSVEDEITPTFLIDAYGLRSTATSPWGASYLTWVGEAFAELTSA